MAAGRLIRVTGRHRRPKRLTLKKVNRRVSKILSGIEKKYFLGDIVATFPTTGGGLVTWLTAIPLGDENNRREGTQVSGVKFQMKYNINFSSASTHDFERCRVMLVEERINQTTLLFGVAQLLSTINTHAYINRSTGRSRFKILMDRTHILNRLSVLAVDVVSPTYQFNRMLRGHKMTFDANTPVPATGVGGEKNQIFLVIISSAGANPANFVGASQYIFTDA